MTPFLIKHHQKLLDAMLVVAAVGAASFLPQLFPFLNQLFPYWSTLFPFWLQATIGGVAALLAVPAMYGMVKAENERNPW